MLRYINPLIWLRSIGQFVSGWFLAISWSHVARAIPAIALLGTLFVGGAIAWTEETSSWRGNLLRTRLRNALNEEDYEAAELLVFRQIQSRPNDADLLYQLAYFRDLNGEYDNATTLMRELVSNRQHEPAARWILEKEYLKRERVEDGLDATDEEKHVEEEERRIELGRLLAIVYEAAPTDQQIQQLYSNYLIRTQRYSLAIPILTEMAERNPVYGLHAAKLSRSLGHDPTADRLATRSLEALNNRWEEDPANAGLAVAVAECQLILSRYEDAVRTLQVAVKRAKTDDVRGQLNQLVGVALVNWATSINETSQKSSVDRLRILRMLQVALQHAPSNSQVLTLVADQVLATVNDENEQVQAVREALIGGSSVGIAHFMRGTASLLKDDIESANVSLKLAAEHMPNAGAILNNLAVAMSLRENADLEQALKVSESAIDRTASPTAHFFDTRGQILLRMERYFEAIPDLERALGVESLALNAHLSLATCYDKVGESELGRLHREAAEQLAVEQANTGSKSRPTDGKRRPGSEVKEPTPVETVSESESGAA